MSIIEYTLESGKSYVLPAAGGIKEIAPANGKKFKLDELQKLVGGYLEMLCPVATGAYLLGDEEGKLKHKPINFNATSLYQEMTNIVDDPVVGDCILIAKGHME